MNVYDQTQDTDTLPINAANVTLAESVVGKQATTCWNQCKHQIDGTTKARANVLMSDGTTQTMTIDRFLVSTQTSARTGHGPANTQMAENGVNTPEPLPVYDYESGTNCTIYAGNQNRMSHSSGAGRLYNNLGCLTLKDDNQPNSRTVCLESDAKIMIRDRATARLCSTW